MQFTRKPTDPDRIVEQVGKAILFANRPDYVNLPGELGGGRANILRAEYRDFNNVTCLHYELDKIIDGQRLWVAKSDQFYWHLRDV